MSEAIFRPARAVLLPLPLLSLLLAGCSINGLFGDRDLAYRDAEEIRALEVPPELNPPPRDESMAVPAVASAREQAAAGTAAPAPGTRVLPAVQGVRYVEDGDRPHLVVDAPPGAVWPRLREFLRTRDIPVAAADPVAGVIQTDWVEEGARRGDEGFLDRLLGGLFEFLGSSGLQDRYRLRIAAGPGPDQTRIYVRHEGREEVLVGDATAAEGMEWVPRPRDPDLEVVMLRHLMAWLAGEGGAEAAAGEEGSPVSPGTAAGDAAGGPTVLHLDTPPDQAWDALAGALEAVGARIEDEDQAIHRYAVSYRPPEAGGGSWWDRLTSVFRGGFDLWVELRPWGQGSEIAVVDEDGDTDTSPEARDLLRRLQAQLH